MKTTKSYILIAIFILAASNGYAAAADGPICGSVEQFNRTKNWRDLPGCTDERDHDDPDSPKTLLGRAKDSFKAFFEAWESGDLDHVDSYSGGCLEYMHGADDAWASNPTLLRAKPAYVEMKRKVQQHLQWLPAVTDLAQRYNYAMMYLDEGRGGDLDTAKMAVSEAKKLQGAIAKVQERNVPDDVIIPGSGSIPAATIGEIKSKLSAYLKDANASNDNAVAIDNAKWEPYTKMLTGDRLKFFNETYRVGSNVYGRGGVYLDKPEQFDTATVMCTRYSGRSGIHETWTVKCYSFIGDRQVSGPRVKTGYGSSAPASAYQ